MRAWFVCVVLVSGCFTRVEERDASVNERPDAAIDAPDASSVGRKDGGTDASVDAGAASGPDAGADSGVDGGGDAGADSDLCLDADGGHLSRPCPLSLGVCAGHLSVCIDGGYAECDYGPDYELTEQRCDGLDNDCDGRVDKSWARTILSSNLDADAGPLFYLNYATAWRAQINVLDGGLMVTSYSYNLVLTPQLELTKLVWLGRFDTQVWPAPIAVTRAGDEFLAATEVHLSPGWRRTLLVYRLHGDGTVDLLADGGVVVVAEIPVSEPVGYRDPELAMVDDGVTTTVVRLGEPVRVARIRRDGSFTDTSLDASVAPALSWDTSVDHFDGGWVLNGAIGSDAVTAVCDESIASCEVVARAAPGFLAVVQTEPLVLRWPDDTCRFTDGGVAYTAAPSVWVMAPRLREKRRPFLMRSISADAGGQSAFPWYLELVLVTTHGEVVIERLTNLHNRHGVSLAPVAGDLHLLVFPEGGDPAYAPPAAPCDRIKAEYLCIP